MINIPFSFATSAFIWFITFTVFKFLTLLDEWHIGMSNSHIRSSVNTTTSASSSTIIWHSIKSHLMSSTVRAHKRNCNSIYKIMCSGNHCSSASISSCCFTWKASPIFPCSPALSYIGCQCYLVWQFPILCVSMVSVVPYNHPFNPLCILHNLGNNIY